MAEPFVPGYDYEAETAVLSERFGGVCVTVAAGVSESTTDAVYGGNSRIGDRGKCVAKVEPFTRGTNILYYDISLIWLRRSVYSKSARLPKGWYSLGPQP